MRRLFCCLLALTIATDALGAPAPKYVPQPTAQLGTAYNGNLVRQILIAVDLYLRKLSAAGVGGSSGSGSGSSIEAEPFVTMAASAVLSMERRLTVSGSGISIADAGPNSTVTIGVDDDLDAIAALAGTAGLLAKTAANTWSLRTLTAPAAGITVSNGDGAAGNPTLALANDLSALEGLGSTGFATRTTTDTWQQRTLTAPASFLTISNPAGIAGNPTFGFSGTSGGIPYFNSTTTVASSGLMAANGVLYGGGVGATPASTAAGTASQVLIGGTPPSFGTVPAAAIAGKAFTKNDETNITLTLNGTPATALLDTVRIVPGWQGTLGVARGGTNIASYAVGDVLYASGATTLTKLADVAAGSYLRSGGVTTAPLWSTLTLPNAITSGAVLYGSAANVAATSALLAANQLVLGGGAGGAPATLGSLGTTTTVLHGNAAGAPSFAAVALAADVSGTLPVGNGGIGITSGTSGGIPYFSGTTTIASSALLAANQLVIGGGAATTPATLGTLGTTTTLLHGNAAGAPTFAAVSLTSEVSGDLPYSSLAQGNQRSVLGVPGGSTADVQSIQGGANQVLRGNTGATGIGFQDSQALTANSETNIGLTLNGIPSRALLDSVRIVPTWAGTLSLARGGSNAALTAVNGGVTYSTASSLALTAAGSTGQVLQSAGAASPTWTTATFPVTAGTSGNVLTSNGTNWTSAAPPAGGSFAAPTDSVQLSSTTGVLTTAMRSDASPRLSQFISPDWRGQHAFVDLSPELRGEVGAPAPLRFHSTFSGANGNVYLQATPGATTNITVEIPNAAGQFSITGNGGIPPTATQVLGKIDSTARIANMASKNITNLSGSSVSTGFFQVSVYLVCTTAEAAAADVVGTVSWNDGSARTENLSRLMTSSGQSSKAMVVYVNSGNISFSTSGYTNPAGGVVPAYTARVRVTFQGI